MVLVKYICLIVLSILADILNLIVAPIVVLFSNERGWLPSQLSWFQTPDNPLDGDTGWKTEHRPFLVESSKFKRYINRVFWLYRNSMYGFAIDVLGAKVLPTDTFEILGSPKVSNRPLYNGLVIRKITRDGSLKYFQIYYIKSWSPTRCVRINIGWKLWGVVPGSSSTCQIVFSPNPFMGYSI
jgi:hypothetical protein